MRAPTTWSVCAAGPVLPNRDGENMSHTPTATLSSRFHGSATPRTIASALTTAGRVGGPAGTSRGVPPSQNVRHIDCPSRRAWTRNWSMATTSSSVREIIMSIAAAATRHGVHQAPTAIGCRMMSVTLTTPSGTTRMPKNVTIHGIVRHRRLSPMKPIRNSTM